MTASELNETRHGFALESLSATSNEPADCIGSSSDAGWRSGLLRLYRARGDSGPFETIVTPDQTIVVHMTGRTELKCFAGGIWRTGITRPGTIGLTPGGETSRLRWRCLDEAGGLSAHLHLPQALLAEATDRYPGRNHANAAGALNALAVDDAAVAHVVGRIAAGMRAGASDLFAETLFIVLAELLVDPQRRWGGDAEDRRRPGLIDEPRLRRALEFMSADLSASLTLDAIAREAGMSKFHFLRMFRHFVGCPPHAFMAQLRLEAARRMLTTSDLPVATIAAIVGYPLARNFATAFRRRYACSPASLRRQP